MSLTYIKFIINSVIRKKSVIITAAIFLFCLISFLIILPILVNMNVLNIWSNTTLTIAQTYLLFICAIFSAVLASYIFRESNDDGTELIIISKPMQRLKIIFSKFIAFFLIGLGLNLLTIIFASFTALLPTMQLEYILDLLLSIFLGNLIIFAFFGSIATLLSAFLNKVIVILISTGLVLLMFVFQILGSIVFETPMLSLYKDKIVTKSYSIQYFDQQDNKFKSEQYVSFNPLVNYSALTTFTWHDYFSDPTNASNASQYWTDFILPKDTTDIISVVDIATQLGLIYNSIGLNEYSYKQANAIFGVSKYFNYSLMSGGGDILNYNANLPIYYGPIIEQKNFKGETFFSPLYISFPGVGSTEAPTLLGLSFDDYICGVIYDNLNRQQYYITFNEQNLSQYQYGFQCIYNNLLNNIYYESPIRSDNDENKYWNLTNDNEAKMYDMLAISLINPLDNTNRSVVSEKNSTISNWFNNPPSNFDKDYFNINNNIINLNERFVQFKYWSMLQLAKYTETFFDKYNDSIKDTSLYLPSSNTKAWESFYIDIQNYNGDNSNIIDLRKEWLNLYNMNLFANYENEYAYSSLDESNHFDRELKKYSAYAYNDNMPYYDADTDTYFMNKLWQYDTTQKHEFYIYAIFWGITSLVIFAIGMIIFNKHDIK